ncbi:hypothetical protein NX059_003440 [Plenodomus lindquistii]|nr:hypothetical protein NX059_003440 [Plenodomus lindquistii]
MIALVRRLRSKSEKYLYDVGSLWDAMNFKKECGHEAFFRWYKDVGLLLQTPDVQAKEIFRVLMEQIKAGKIRKGEYCDKCFVYQGTPPPPLWPEEESSHETSVTTQPNSATSENTSGGPDALPATEESTEHASDEELKGKKRWGRPGGFTPNSGQWQC